MDDTFDRLLNIQSYNDEALKDLLQRLSDEEREISKKRRILHAEIDILRAEMVRRARDKHATGQEVVSGGDISALTAILRGPGSGNADVHTKAAVPMGDSATPPTSTESGGEEASPGGQGAASAAGVRDRFHDLSVNEREERLIRYIVKQLGQDRSLDDILSDEYMKQQASEAKRAELLQNPRVIRALQEEIKRQFAEYDSGAKSGPDKPPSS